MTHCVITEPVKDQILFHKPQRHKDASCAKYSTSNLIKSLWAALINFHISVGIVVLNLIASFTSTTNYQASDYLCPGAGTQREDAAGYLFSIMLIVPNFLILNH